MVIVMGVVGGRVRYSTGQRKVKRVPRNLRVYYAGTRLFYAECGDSLHV